MEKFLEGKGAVITGAASGFGRGDAIRFAELGANLVLADVNMEKLEETERLVKEKGAQVLIKQCDVTSWEEVRNLAKEAFATFDNIYILVNNAGVGLDFKTILAGSEDIWDKTFNINLKGQWLVAKAFYRKMKMQKFEPLAGKMINMASIAGVKIDPYIPIYSLSKMGVIGLTELLAAQLAPKITVNCVSPGYHVTGIYNWDEKIMVGTMEAGGVKTLLDRIGTIEDIVKVIEFLSSPASDFITGQNFVVDGGIVSGGVPSHL
jgi:3-oxoacyl-[acyl-carrier protein] reductase